MGFFLGTGTVRSGGLKRRFNDNEVWNESAIEKGKTRVTG
jgi:hypothetical protein